MYAAALKYGITKPKLVVDETDLPNSVLGGPDGSQRDVSIFR